MKIALFLIVLSNFLTAQVVDRSPYLTNQDLHYITFYDNLTGWCGGKAGTLLKTTDGGKKWFKVNTGIQETIIKIHLVDKGTVLLETKNRSGNLLLYGNESGFTKIDLGNVKDYYSIHFNNNFLYFKQDSLLYKSSNMGKDWETITIPSKYFQIAYLNNDTIFVNLFNYTLYKTFDGGKNWKIDTLRTDFYEDAPLFFVNSNFGYGFSVVTSGSLMPARTTDGGLTWQGAEGYFRYSSNMKINSNFFSVREDWSDKGYTIVEFSVDSLRTLTQIKSPNYLWYNDITLLTPTSGFICGMQGIIYKFEVKDSTINIIKDTEFIWDVASADDKNAIAVGDNGTILKTIDSGLNWVKIKTNFVDNFKNIIIKNNQTFIFGDSTYLYAPDFNLKFQKTSLPFDYKEIHVDNSHVYLLSNDGFVYQRYYDYWQKVFTFNDKAKSISIIDDRGFAVIDNWLATTLFKKQSLYKYFSPFKTISTQNGRPEKIHFFDLNNGLIVDGKLYITNDAGETWREKEGEMWIREGSNKSAVIDSVTFFMINGYDLIDDWFYQIYYKKHPNDWVALNDRVYSHPKASINFTKTHGWFASFNTILRININDIPLDIKESENIDVVSDFSLSQNYPNPFNPVTTISFTLPKESFTKLIIYNSLGEQVETLINEYKNSGKYDIVWDGKNVSSGIYFYRLETENYNSVKKMILMK